LVDMTIGQHINLSTVNSSTPSIRRPIFYRHWPWPNLN
jgi:hypothetical protein